MGRCRPALRTVRREWPDVVLLDIRMPDVDGLPVLRRVRELPDSPIVAMLTTFDTDEYIIAALRSGAAGFLLKDTEPEQLVQLVRSLAAAGVVMSPKASRSMLQSHSLTTPAANDMEAARVGRLTDREREVLSLVAQGLSNADIGARIHLSVGTIGGGTGRGAGSLPSPGAAALQPPRAPAPSPGA
ncbi:response regulator, partial [Streptomyces sp. NPDC056390]|uniref:response regulator n=1 Tax=Streptomyces sp. NPDC056390 TaxID=3345806 RepID=UPI0035E37B67